jgi:hypothetical protein
MNTQTANVATMQQQTEMFARRINQEMEMLCKEGIPSFALSAKVKKRGTGNSKKKGKEAQRAISANDAE